MKKFALLILAFISLFFISNLPSFADLSSYDEYKLRSDYLTISSRLNQSIAISLAKDNAEINTPYELMNIALKYTEKSSTNGNKVLLQNGAVLIFYSLKDECSPTLGKFKNGSKDTACLMIAVDVNGSNEPNITGKDRFYLYGYSDAILFP